MTTFEITVRGREDREAGAWPVVAQATRTGSLPVREEGRLCLDLAHLEARRSVAEYGEALGRALFTGDIRDLFLDVAGDGDVRVLLFVEDETLKSLHWQRLAAPRRQGGFHHLALDQRTPLSLYLPSASDRRFPPIGRRDLRALVVVANPAGLEKWKLAPLDDEAALVESVRRALGEIPCDVLARTEGAVGPPTLPELRRRLTHGGYTLLHVVAHGRFVAGQPGEASETFLYLEHPEPRDPDKRVQMVSGRELIDELAQHGAGCLPHLAFFATCESAAPDAEGALAQRLVAELGLPAVVAMTEKVTMETAGALAAAFYARLREHGEADRALAEATAGLAEHYDVTVPALYTRLAGQPVFSDALDRALHDEDLRRGLAELEELVAARAPVLLPELRRHHDVLEGCLGVAADQLEPAARARREDALREVGNLAEEVLEMSFHALALGQKPPDDRAARVPFRGLEPFDSDHAEDFHRRETLVEEVVERLRRERILLLTGPSGSGKTSVALAGLVPALRRLEPDLEVCTLMPDARACEELEALLGNGAPPGDGDASGDRPALLVVDPLETLLLEAPEETARAFLARLAQLPELYGSGRDWRVVVVLGESFLDGLRDLAEDGGLTGDTAVSVPPLGPRELREAAEQQARHRAGLRFEAGLLDLVLDDLGGDAGAMTGVQVVLTELWKRRHGPWLRLGEYQALREDPYGLTGLLARHAERTWRAAADLERPLLRHLFLRLVEPGAEEHDGARPHDTARRVELCRLVPAGESPAVIRRLAGHLAAARLVVLRSCDEKGGEQVELTSERLLADWPRLAKWLDDDRALLHLREEIGAAAERWHLSPEEQKAGLVVHRGLPLREIEDHLRQGRLVLNDAEQTYVEACRHQEDDQRDKELEAARRLAEESEGRRRAEEERAREAEARLREQALATAHLRRRAVALGILAVVAVVLAWFAWRAAAAATAARRLGLVRQLAAQSLTRHDTRLDQSLLLAVEAFSFLDGEGEAQGATDAEARQSLLAAMVHNPALETYLHGHDGPVTALAASVDGSLLASASGRSVLLWRAGERVAFARLGEADNQDPDAGHIGRVENLAFSPDGGTLASASADRSVLVWDLKDVLAGEETAPVPVHRLTGHRDAVYDVAWSPDGQTLSSVSVDGTVGLWDAATGRFHRYLEKDAEGELAAVAWSSDGRTLAAGGRGPQIYLWDVDSGNLRRTLQLEHYHRVWDLAWTPWDARGENDPAGGILAVGGDSLEVTLFDMGRGELLASLAAHRDSAKVVAWSPDGSRLASGGGDSVIHLWSRSPDGFELTRSLTGHDGWLTGVAWSGDQVLTSAASDTSLIRWRTEVDNAGPLVELGCRGDYGVYRLALSSDGRRLALASLPFPRILVCDTESGEVLHELAGHEPSSMAVAFRPDGTLLASGGFDGQVLLWDLATGEAGSPLAGHQDWVISLAWSPNGQVLASGGRDGVILLWDPLTGESTGRLEGHEDSVTDLAWSPDGRALLSGSGDNRMVLWDPSSGEELRRFEPGSSFGIWSVAWSPDGRMLASGGGDTRVLLWDAETGEQLGEPLAGATSRIQSLAFSPDGHTLAAVAYNVSVLLWDVASRQFLGQLSDPETAAGGNASWSPDGRFLYAGVNFVISEEEGYSRAARFSVDVAEWRKRACRRANRRLSEEEWRSFVSSSSPYEPACRAPSMP